MNDRRPVRTWSFSSKSRPEAYPYETILWSDGSLTCDCQGWTIKKKNVERTCRHVRSVSPLLIAKDWRSERPVTPRDSGQRMPIGPRMVFARAPAVFDEDV